MEQRRLSVVREHDFDDQLARIVGDPIRADEFVAVAVEVLSIDPTIGIQIDAADGLWSLPMAPVADRQVTLYYTFDSQEVLLLFIASGE